MIFGQKSFDCSYKKKGFILKISYTVNSITDNLRVFMLRYAIDYTKV